MCPISSKIPKESRSVHFDRGIPHSVGWEWHDIVPISANIGHFFRSLKGGADPFYFPCDGKSIRQDFLGSFKLLDENLRKGDLLACSTVTRASK